MANTFWEDRGSTEILSSHINGLQDAVKNIEQSLNMDTEEVVEESLTLSADAVGIKRIAEAVGKRNWLNDPAPVIEQKITGDWQVTNAGFVIDYAGGAVLFDDDQDGEMFRASFTRVKKNKAARRTARVVIGNTLVGWTIADCDYLCDGTADDVKINAAIQSLPEEGGEIVLLDGTYIIEAPIRISKDNVTLRGNGFSTVLERAFNGEDPHSSEIIGVYDTLALGGRVIAGCKIENLKIDGKKATYPSQLNAALYFFKVERCIITHTYLYYNAYGIRFSGQYSWITENRIVSSLKSAIFFDGASLYNHILHNECHNSSEMGIYFAGSDIDANFIKGNNCNNNQTGIKLSPVPPTGYNYLNLLEGNRLSDNDVGIYANRSVRCLIINNLCYISGTYKGNQNTIYFVGGYESLITNNLCWGKAPQVIGNDNTEFNNKYDASSDWGRHLKDYAAPHKYEDEGLDPNWSGVKYRLVMIDGNLFMEVV